MITIHTQKHQNVNLIELKFITTQKYGLKIMKN